MNNYVLECRDCGEQTTEEEAVKDRNPSGRLLLRCPSCDGVLKYVPGLNAESNPDEAAYFERIRRINE